MKMSSTKPNVRVRCFSIATVVLCLGIVTSLAAVEGHMPRTAGSLHLEYRGEQKQLIPGEDLGRVLARGLEGTYRTKDPARFAVKLNAFLLDREGRVVSQCESNPVSIPPNARLSGNELFEAGWSSNCFLAGENPVDGRVEFETVGTRSVDGRPVNLGLWAREQTKADFVAAVALMPADSGALRMVQGGGFAVALKYPIEHG
jgi:hypothetical protein